MGITSRLAVLAQTVHVLMQLNRTKMNRLLDYPYLTLLFTHFQEYITYYIFWSKFLLVEMIPYITIIVLNSMILGKIWKSTQFRKRFVVSEGCKCRAMQN